jgi:hypothetical protein
MAGAHVSRVQKYSIHLTCPLDTSAPFGCSIARSSFPSPGLHPPSLPALPLVPAMAHRLLLLLLLLPLTLPYIPLPLPPALTCCFPIVTPSSCSVAPGHKSQFLCPVSTWDCPVCASECTDVHHLLGDTGGHQTHWGASPGLQTSNNAHMRQWVYVRGILHRQDKTSGQCSKNTHCQQLITGC